jgi:prepilin-type N-terminal cleavage/methylation domain-containing protein
MRMVQDGLDARSAVLDHRGFTLFEVLVSVSILSIAVVVILQLFSAGLRNLTSSDEYVKATIRAEAIMRDVVEGEIEEGEFSVTTDDGYDVDVRIKGVEDERFENLQVNLLNISLTLRWTDGVNEKTINLDTMKVVKRGG